MVEHPVSQADVAAWFDATYRKKGLRYLRPRRAYPIFVQLLGLSPGARLLDVACGPGLLLCAAVERGLAAAGVDLSTEAVSLAQELLPAADVREPVEVSGRLLELYQDSRLCPHFHMSIQSANTDVLFHMKRKYTQEDVRRSLWAIAEKVPGSFVGMDVITGFPTETAEQFEDTYQTLKDLPWTKLHVFPYRERQGTRAAAMDVSVYPHIRAERAARLRELSLARYEIEAQRQVGQTKKVLVLKNAAKGGQGLSHDYWPVDIVGAEGFLDHSAGQEIEVQITGYDHSNKQHMEGHLIGEVLA